MHDAPLLIPLHIAFPHQLSQDPVHHLAAGSDPVGDFLLGKFAGNPANGTIRRGACLQQRGDPLHDAIQRDAAGQPR